MVPQKNKPHCGFNHEMVAVFPYALYCFRLPFFSKGGRLVAIATRLERINDLSKIKDQVCAIYWRKVLKKMEQLNIKGVSISTQKMLADKARAASMSKNAYLKKLLDTHVIAEEVEGIRTDYEELVKSCLQVIQHNTKVINEFIRINEEG